MRGSAAVYGINTGFGHLKNKRVPGDQLDKLQDNLILSHAVGVGPPAPPEVVRWMLLFKLNMLLRGHSGVRTDVIRHMQTCLNADMLPIVPTRGSLGASGDLAPLAHMVMGLLGRGEMSVPDAGPRRPAAPDTIGGRDARGRRAGAATPGRQGRLGAGQRHAVHVRPTPRTSPSVLADWLAWPTWSPA